MVTECRPRQRHWCAACELYWTFWLYLQGDGDPSPHPAWLRRRADARERIALKRL